MNEQQFRELSAARAVHALSPDEERAFSAALAAHPEWTVIADEDAETAAEIVADEVAPPPAIRAALLDAIERVPQDGASTGAPAVAPVEVPAQERRDATGSVETSASRPSRLSRGRAAWFALAACGALLLALVIAFPVRSALAPNDPVSVALERVESASDAQVFTAEFDGSGRASVHWSASEDRAVFVAEGLPELSGERDFELWIVRGDTPISLGVIAADGGGEEVAALAPGFRDGDIVAVTIEQRGGSPTGAPTTDPILAVASA